MTALIDELFACEMPQVSISGKPIIVTFSLEELLQKFEKYRYAITLCKYTNGRKKPAHH